MNLIIQKDYVLLDKYSAFVEKIKPTIDLDEIPVWVKDFYNPQTLIELLAWVAVLKIIMMSLLSLACFPSLTISDTVFFHIHQVIQCRISELKNFLHMIFLSSTNIGKYALD